MLVWETERDRQLLKNSWPQEVATKAKAHKHSWSIVGWVQRVTFSNLEIILEGCCYSFTVLRLTKTLKHQDFFWIVAAVRFPRDKMKSEKNAWRGKSQILCCNEKPTTGHEQIKSHRLGSNMASPRFLTILISSGQGWPSMHHEPSSRNTSVQTYRVGYIFLSGWISSYRIIWTPISSCWPRPSDASQLSVGGSPPDFHICAFLVFHCAAKSGTKRRRGQRLCPFWDHLLRFAIV